MAAFRELTHPELLELIGSRPSSRRDTLYARCRSALTPDVRTFWDARSAEIAAGIGSAGKMERYFALFRTKLLPLIHSQARGLEMMRTEGCRRSASASTNPPGTRGAGGCCSASSSRAR